MNPTNPKAFTLIEPLAMSDAKRKAFTLIELLVVVTIMVVLLALLMPALDKAVYQAELTVCMTRLKGIATCAGMYAMDNRRAYPDRSGARGDNSAFGLNTPGVDDRKLLRPYMSLNKQIICPLAPGKMDIEASLSTSYIELPYYLFFGIQFSPEKGMFRMGDRWEWQGDRFSVLASDLDNLDSQNNVAYTSHQDRDRVMAAWWGQDSFFGGLAGGPTTGTGHDFTFTRWSLSGTGTYQRSAIDENHAFEDGSARRYEQVGWDETEPGGKHRMSKAPHYLVGDPFPQIWSHVPLQ